jgi:hypothetical protein
MVLPYLERGLVLDHSRDFHRLDCRSSEHSLRVLGRRGVAGVSSSSSQCEGCCSGRCPYHSRCRCHHWFDSFLAVRSEVILGTSVGLTNRCSQPLNRSHDAVIRVYDDAGNVIETPEYKGDFKEW